MCRKGEHVLNQLDDIRLGRIPIYIKELNSGSSYAVGYSDGDIEFRDFDMSVQPAEDKADQASMLTRIGFSFDKIEPSISKFHC